MPRRAISTAEHVRFIASSFIPGVFIRRHLMRVGEGGDYPESIHHAYSELFKGRWEEVLPTGETVVRSIVTVGVRGRPTKKYRVAKYASFSAFFHILVKLGLVEFTGREEAATGRIVLRGPSGEVVGEEERVRRRVEGEWVEGVRVQRFLSGGWEFVSGEQRPVRRYYRLTARGMAMDEDYFARARYHAYPAWGPRLTTIEELVVVPEIVTEEMPEVVEVVTRRVPEERVPAVVAPLRDRLVGLWSRMSGLRATYWPRVTDLLLPYTARPTPSFREQDLDLFERLAAEIAQEYGEAAIEAGVLMSDAENRRALDIAERAEELQSVAHGIQDAARLVVEQADAYRQATQEVPRLPRRVRGAGNSLITQMGRLWTALEREPSRGGA